MVPITQPVTNLRVRKFSFSTNQIHGHLSGKGYGATAAFTEKRICGDVVIKTDDLNYLIDCYFFRTAHQIVGTLARMDAAPSLETIDEIGLSMIGRRLSDSGLDEQAISDALDPVSGIRAHVSGGPAPDDVVRVIAIFENALQKDLIALDARCKHVNDAAGMLDREVQACKHVR